MERLAYAGDELGGENRVASYIIKIVVDTDTFDIEDLGPEPCQHLLKGCMRRSVCGVEGRLLLSGDR